MTQLIRDNTISTQTAPSLPWHDPAVQHGWGGFFETMRFDSGVIRRFESHIHRLRSSLQAWDLEWNITPEILKEAIQRETTVHPPQTPLRVKLMVGEDPAAPPSPGRLRSTRAWLDATPLEGEYLKPFNQKHPYRLGILGDFRVASSHPLAGHKSTHYGPYRESLYRAQKHGWDDAILLNEKSEIVEASRFNVFWVKGECLHTPSPTTGCLPGVMAAEIERIAKGAGIRVDRCAAEAATLMKSEAIFLTNSVAEIVPVGRVDDVAFRPLQEVPPGRRLLEALRTADSCHI